MKCGTAAIIGRPSSGKSTITNTITEMKVSIVAKTPQTTRNAIKGIYTDQRGQIIFTDTPGYHLNEQALNRRLQEVTIEALKDSDVILYMTDGTRSFGVEEEAVISIIRSAKTKVVCCINKSDMATDEQMDALEGEIRSRLGDIPILRASAMKDEGIDEVLIELFKCLPEGDLLYDENSYTDQPLEFRISEIIREKAINLVSDELPHAIYVEVSDLEYDEENQKVWIRAFIVVERETQKGIVVGKGGKNIRQIRVESFREIKRIFPGMKLEIDLRVKAQPKWRKNSIVLDKIFRV